MLNLFTEKMEEQDEITSSELPRRRCKNCGKKLAKKGEFCSSCGQRDFDGRVRMRELLEHFFTSFTHLDNKFIKMGWQLLIPARVTINYFQGKIKRYPHPVHFFFIVMFFFLLMFSKQFDNAGMNMTGENFNLSISGEKPAEKSKSEKLLKESGLFAVLEHGEAAKKYRAAIDSLPSEWRSPPISQAVDSVLRIVQGPWEDAMRDFSKLANRKDSTNIKALDSLTLNFAFTTVRIAISDLVNLSSDEITKQYGFTDWAQKIAVRQGIKSLKDPKSLIHRYVGSFGWAILVLIAIMAFVLRLLYWKRGGYYVEHFIFLMHQQAGAFLLLTLAMAVNEYLFHLSWIWLPLMAWIGVSLLLAMKRFYGESWAWTTLKWLVYCVLYVLGLIALFIATMLVVFMIF